MPKVYVEQGQKCLQDVFRLHPLNWEIVFEPDEAEIIVLNGGSDIDPAWYGQLRHPRTHFNDRDEVTATLTEIAIRKGLPLIGICRGAQFINAICGGDMYQDVDNHHGQHDVIDLDTGKIYAVNSIHHQMMIPAPEAMLVAVAREMLSSRKTKMVGNVATDTLRDDKHNSPDVECLYYPKIRALCFQAHPEYANVGEGTRVYFFHLLQRFYPEYFQ